MVSHGELWKVNVEWYRNVSVYWSSTSRFWPMARHCLEQYHGAKCKSYRSASQAQVVVVPFPRFSCFACNMESRPFSFGSGFSSCVRCPRCQYQHCNPFQTPCLPALRSLFWSSSVCLTWLLAHHFFTRHSLHPLVAILQHHQSRVQRSTAFTGNLLEPQFSAIYLCLPPAFSAVLLPFATEFC